MMKKTKKTVTAANIKMLLIRVKRNNQAFLKKRELPAFSDLVEYRGEYFPRKIMEVQDVRMRKEMMKLYSRLMSGLKLQKRYRKNNLQKEPELLKLSKWLGLFPEHYTDQDPETKAWFKRQEQLRRARLLQRAKNRAAQNKRKIKVNYAQMLAKECEAAGITYVKPRRVRKSKVGKVTYAASIARPLSPGEKRVREVNMRTLNEAVVVNSSFSRSELDDMLDSIEAAD